MFHILFCFSPQCVPGTEVYRNAQRTVGTELTLCPPLTHWRGFGKKRKINEESPRAFQLRERSDRDNWDLNDVSTRNLNWMSKWHHYLRLSCAKRLFFRKAIKQAIGGGLYLKWTAARNMKYNLLPLMQSRSNDSMHACIFIQTI